MSKETVKLQLLDRAIKFDMNLDMNFPADRNTKIYLDRNGSCEPELVHLMMRVLHDGDYAIDVGANVGFFTLLMATLVGPKGKVTAFEPVESNLRRLDENLKLNKITTVEVVPRPLWSCADRVTVHQGEDSGLSSLAKNSLTLSSAEMQADCLDPYLERRKPTLIKIDAEGAEEHILVGGGLNLTPAEVPYVVAEMNEEALERFGSDPQSLRALVEGYGYEMFILREDGGLPALVPDFAIIDSSKHNLNILFSTLDLVGEAWPQIVVSA